MYYRISKNEKILFFGKKIAQVWAVTLNESILMGHWVPKTYVFLEKEEKNNYGYSSNTGFIQASMSKIQGLFKNF